MGHKGSIKLDILIFGSFQAATCATFVTKLAFTKRLALIRIHSIMAALAALYTKANAFHTTSFDMIASMGSLSLTSEEDVSNKLQQMNTDIVHIDSVREEYLVEQHGIFEDESEGLIRDVATKTTAIAVMHVITTYMHLVEQAWIKLECKEDRADWEERVLWVLLKWPAQHLDMLEKYTDEWPLCKDFADL